MSSTPTDPTTLAVFQYTVDRGGTLRDAMHALEHGAEIALVTDGVRLVGVLTDGDVRRALLAGAVLNAPLAPFVHPRCVTVQPTARRDEVLELMQARKIGQIPIVDAGGRLLGLHRLHDVLGVAPRANWAVIMAGGRGTRLGALTAQVPKPMLRVAGRPILERIVLHLVGYGIRRIFMATNYLAHVIQDHFGDGQAMGVQIEYLREERPLGTGGALALLPETPRDPLLVMNGDLVTQADLGGMLDAHARRAAGPPAVATVGVRRYLHTVPFGCLEVDGDTVAAFEEKPTLTRLVNAGIYVLEPALLARVPRDHEFPLPALLEDCLRRGERVRAFEVTDDWVDVGQREQLQQAREGGTL
jgi:dTDP-glucose pyrophosphorylase